MNKTDRINTRDMEESIFRPEVAIPGGDTDRNFGQEPQKIIMCFTILGKHEYVNDSGDPMVYDEDSSNVLAKMVTIDDGVPRYMIKRDSNGRLFNPLGIDEGNHNKFIHRAGKEQYEFRSVNRTVFNFYLQFLKTKNLMHLRNAEREAF